MEARNITVVNTRTQTRIDFTSTAETLGELKKDFTANGIDYADMAFYEGISKATFEDDAAILPTNLPWKGKRTNDLSFMLTEKRNKIKNGAVSTRTEAYNYVKENNLQKEVEAKYGDNFTRCKTAQLVEFCNNHAQPKAAPAKKAPKTAKKVVKVEKKVVAKKAAEAVVCKAKKAVKEVVASCGDKLANLLVAKGYISAKEAQTGKPDAMTSANLSKKDIDEMFKNVR